MQMKSSVTLGLALAMSATLALRAEEAAKPAAAPAAKPAAAPAAKAESASPTAKAEAAPVAKNDAPGSVKKGNELVDAGKFDEAVAYYEGIGEQTTANGHAKREPWRLIGLANAYIGLGKFDKAAEAAQKAIDIDPKLSAAWNDLGSAQANQGMRKEAIATYEKGIETLKAATVDAGKLETNLAALKAAADEAQAKADKKAGKKPAADAKSSTPAAEAKPADKAAAPAADGKAMNEKK